MTVTVNPQFLPTLTDSLEQGMRNGMSFKQLRQRIPAFVARKLSISEQDFHAQLEAANSVASNDLVLELIVQVVASKFTPAEQRAIAARK